MEILADVLEYISLGIGLIAIVIILWGVIRGIIEYAKAKLAKYTTEQQRLNSLGRVRYDLGYHLLIALEFLIAADIIRTVIRPTLEELGILGVIVAIRVVLSYFLHREIGHNAP
ncbi:DUF1622 domain-containing protein [Chloroflexota bacterium]